MHRFLSYCLSVCPLLHQTLKNIPRGLPQMDYIPHLAHQRGGGYLSWKIKEKLRSVQFLFSELAFRPASLDLLGQVQAVFVMMDPSQSRFFVYLSILMKSSSNEFI